MKDSLYSAYLKERTTDSIIEWDTGFATYRYINDGKTVYIVDIFTLPEGRKYGTATALANLIAKEAKEKGCKDMWGTVQPSAKGSDTSLRVLLGYGMKLHSATQDCIIFQKDL